MKNKSLAINTIKDCKVRTTLTKQDFINHVNKLQEYEKNDNLNEFAIRSELVRADKREATNRKLQLFKEG